MSFDNIWQWSETAASNTAIASIDITGATGKVKDGDNAIRAAMSQIITMEGKGSDVASAGTLTLGTERYYHVTGATTITDIDFTDAVDGRWAWLIFDGALTLTHNSTTLKLPGNANITTAAGDRALFVQDSSDNIICLQYVRAAIIPPTTGTFTPTVVGTSTAGTGTYTRQNGNYTRIGDRVFYEVALTWTAHTGTGNMRIDGLPFTAATTGPYSASVSFGSMTYTSHPQAVIINGTSSIQLQMAASGAAETLIGIDTAMNINISGHYIAA